MAAENSTHNNTLIARVSSYYYVGYLSDAVKGYYSYAKDYNQLVKGTLETAEQYAQPILQQVEAYSHQPTIDSLLHKVDQYGCKQLDKLEYGGKQLKQTYETVKPKTIKSLDSIATKIHGTPIEVPLLKTASIVDAVVDALFPPYPSEPAEISRVPEDPNILARTTPIINKLFERVNADSIKQLPAHSYTLTKDLLFRVDTMPQVHYCVGVLATAAHKIKEASTSSSTIAVQKGKQLKKESVEYVYQSLTHLVTSLGAMLALIKKLDPVEAKVTVEELLEMIKRSKASLGDQFNKWDATTFKHDIAAILQKAGDKLAEKVSKQYTHVQSSDNAAIRNSVATIENLVLRIIDRFAPPSPTRSPTPSPPSTPEYQDEDSE